jgi:hypothetical protein
MRELRDIISISGGAKESNNATSTERAASARNELKQLKKVRDMLTERLFRDLSAAISAVEASSVPLSASDDTSEVVDDSINSEIADARLSVDEPTASDPPSESLSNTLLSRVVEKPKRGLKLNGRICDAVLRCYVDDVSKAKYIWKEKLLPLARRTEHEESKALGTPAREPENTSARAQRLNAFDEIAQKGLEALMFVSGYARRADLGFEIALTARKRSWPMDSRQRLGRAYVQGKVQASAQQQGAQSLSEREREKKAPGGNVLSELLNSGLERSIESELGVLLESSYGGSATNSNSNNEKKAKKGSTWPVQRIRIQFGEPTTNVQANSSSTNIGAPSGGGKRLRKTQRDDARETTTEEKRETTGIRTEIRRTDSDNNGDGSNTTSTSDVMKIGVSGISSSSSGSISGGSGSSRAQRKGA